MAKAEVQRLIGRLKMPAIAAPMFLVSNPALTLACCAEGIMGSFPAHGTRSREQFQAWLDEMVEGMKRLQDDGRKPAPWAVNLVVHPSNPRYPGDLELVEKYKVPVVLTSKGAPGDAIRRIHGWGAVALHDIANRRDTGRNRPLSSTFRRGDSAGTFPRHARHMGLFHRSRDIPGQSRPVH